MAMTMTTTTMTTNRSHNTFALVLALCLLLAILASTDLAIVRLPKEVPVATLLSNVIESHATRDHPLCRAVGSEAPLSLWMRNKNSIVDENSNDDTFAKVLRIISPRLPLARKAMTRQHASMDLVMNKLWKRWEYLKSRNGNDNGTVPDPLKITVYGGSVTHGTGCRINKKMHGTNCAWPMRLESLINNYFGVGTLVEVHNLAVGATDSFISSSIFTHDMQPEQGRDADIVINAHGTNDAHHIRHVLKNITSIKEVIQMIEGFTRTVMNNHIGGCKGNDDDPLHPPPLFLYLSDYIGNKINGIVDVTSVEQALSVVAPYYGFAAVSYPDVIRDVIFHNPHESFLSPKWYDKDGTPKRQNHPGPPAHMSMAIIMAYTFLEMVSTRCHDNDNGERIPSDTLLPPPLTDDLTLSNVDTRWKEATKSNNAQCTSSPKCIFSFFGGYPTKSMPFYLNDYVIRNDWVGQMWNDKFSWVPPTDQSAAAVMTLHFPSITTPVSEVVLIVLKSYGPEWEESSLEAVATSSTNVRHELAIAGSHASRTSIMYSEVLQFNKPIGAGSDLTLTITLVSGHKARILGIAVC